MSTIDQVQQEVAAHLAASELFPPGVCISAKEPRTIASIVKDAAELHGLAISVLPPVPLEAQETGGAAHLFFPRVELVVRITEQVIFNETRMEAAQAWQAVCMVLQGWTPSCNLERPPLQLMRKPFRGDLYKDSGGLKQLWDIVFFFAADLPCVEALRQYETEQAGLAAIESPDFPESPESPETQAGHSPAATTEEP